MKYPDNSVLRPTFKIENSLQGIIAGCDEAGRGPVAGPVVASCVVFLEKVFIDKLNDSKKMSPNAREKVYQELIRNPFVIYSIGYADVSEIDTLNIYNATKLAMKRAYENIKLKIDYLLIDGNMKIDADVPQISIVKGDAKSVSIASASVIAKVTRDRFMDKLAKKYPCYEFDKHKGYCTKRHIELLKKYGVSEVHRKSFEPVASMIKE